MKAALLALSLTLWAPYQCGTEPNERPQEDSAPKALWQLSERFESEGNSAARETTLNQLVDRYPSSHYAEQARIALGLPSRKNERKQTEDKPEKDEEPASGGEDTAKDPESGDE
ncbi:MAG: hypothetical protein JWN48_687 [Myxococcaceae bacterium]|nr:hypothetical protein [Myxococcaceae bacterium]